MLCRCFHASARATNTLAGNRAPYASHCGIQLPDVLDREADRIPGFSKLVRKQPARPAKPANVTSNHANSSSRIFVVFCSQFGVFCMASKA